MKTLAAANPSAHLRVALATFHAQTPKLDPKAVVYSANKTQYRFNPYQLFAPNRTEAKSPEIRREGKKVVLGLNK